MSSSEIKYLGALSAMAGCVIWLMLWIHFLLTHGTTANNMEGVLLGLTWFDTDKLVVVPMLLFMLCVVSLRAWQRESTGRIGTAGYVITLVCFATIIIGQSLLYWPVPWGSYPPEDFWSNDFTQRVAVPLAILSAPLLAIGLILFGVDVLRRKPLPGGNALPLLLGIALLTTPWLRDTVHSILFAVGWGVLGYILWRSDPKAVKVISSP